MFSSKFCISLTTYGYQLNMSFSMTPFPQQSQCLCSPRLSKPPRPSTRTFAKNTMMFCRSVSRSSRKRWSSKPPCNCQVFDIEDNLGRLNKVSPIYLLSLVAFHSFTVISASLHFCSLFLFLYTPDIRTSSSSLSSVVLFLVFFFSTHLDQSSPWFSCSFLLPIATGPAGHLPHVNY